MSGLFAQSVAIYIQKIQSGKSRLELDMKKTLAKNRRAEQSVQNKVCPSNTRTCM